MLAITFISGIIIPLNFLPVIFKEIGMLSPLSYVFKMLSHGIADRFDITSFLFIVLFIVLENYLVIKCNQ